MRAKAKQKIRGFLSPFVKPPSGGSSTVSQNASPNPSRAASPALSTSANPPTTATFPATVQPQHASSGTVQNKQQRALELTSSFQTLLTVVEKTLDGVPIWGPKAIVGAAAEVLKVTQLKKDNDETIKEIQRDAAHIISIASPSGGLEGALPTSTPTELQMRLDNFKAEISSYLNELDRYQAARPLPQPPDLKERVKMLLAAGGELLAAEAISNALSEVNRKIAASIQNFMLVSQIKSEETLHSVDEKVATILHEVQAGKVDEVLRLVTAILHTTQNIATPHNKDSKTLISQDERTLLTQLNPVMTALHNSKGAPRKCHEGTRVAVLEHVANWFRDPKSPSLLWLSGIAGTGKTTIAQSVCETLAADLGASFLFSREDVDRQDPSNVLPTIVYQLAYSRPTLRPAICEMVSQFPDFATKSIQVQAQELMTKVFSSDLKANLPTTLLLFDALDECNKEDGQEGGGLIPFLLRFLRTNSSRFKILLTSRPETSIRRMLEGKNGQAHLFVLHEVDKNMVQSDIETYLRYEFAQMAAKRNLDGTWTESVRENQVRQLAILADRLFIFASTLVKALSKSPFPAGRIQSFLDDVGHSAHMLRGSLDRMYLQIVQAVLTDDVDELDAKELVEAFQCVAGAIVTLQKPLAFTSLKNLLSVKEDRLSATITPLYSVLDVDDLLQRPIQVFHLSFPDFLTDNARCTDVRFFIVPKDSHSILSVRCLRIMNEHLKQDICKIEDPSLLNSEVQDLRERLEIFTSAELRYACSYWWAHLIHVDALNKELVDELEQFTSERILQWLELLSVMGQLQSALSGLPKAIEWYKGLISSSKLQGSRQSYEEDHLGSELVSHPEAAGWDKTSAQLEDEDSTRNLANIPTTLYDTNRTVQAFFRPISESALHVYESALTFMPHCSLRSQSYQLGSKRVTIVEEIEWCELVGESNNGSMSWNDIVYSCIYCA